MFLFMSAGIAMPFPYFFVSGKAFSRNLQVVHNSVRLEHHADAAQTFNVDTIAGSQGGSKKTFPAVVNIFLRK